MDAEPQPHSQAKSYAASWNFFVDRAMQILVERPTVGRYTIKYVPNKKWFVLKVTDGQVTVMKRADADTEFEKIEQFTYLATRALTNEVEEAKKAEKELEKPTKDSKKNKNKNKNKK